MADDTAGGMTLGQEAGFLGSQYGITLIFSSSLFSLLWGTYNYYQIKSIEMSAE